MQTYQVFKIFISSPSDVAEEREIAEDVITKVNRTCRDILGVFLETSKWEKMPPITPNLPEEKIQDIIEKELRACNAFVLILFNRYGAIESEQKKSRTQREVELALEILKKYKQLMFLSYFRSCPENSDKGPQRQAVDQLKAELQKKEVWYSNYTSPELFRDKFTHDLYNTVLRFSLSTRKHRCLQAFWQLGITERNNHPQVVISYPPVDKGFMKQPKSISEMFWQGRLAPHVVFEDFKAVLKVEKTLRIIGLHDFNTYGNHNIPLNIDEVNRVWLCIPRSPIAINYLQKYSEVSKFKFAQRKAHSESRIYWKYGLQSNFIEIKSPLSQYLHLQRKKDPTGNWTRDKAMILAKDFAILARFSDMKNKQAMEQGILKDYFIAGIRGLGTWGAAWFIDRCYDTFEVLEKEPDLDFQMLLEVTYADERIVRAIDVSNQPESYFHQQNDPSEIKKQIKEYQVSK